jgi:hypothetical protein
VAGLGVGMLLLLGGMPPPMVLDWSMMCPVKKVTKQTKTHVASADALSAFFYRRAIGRHLFYL